MTESRINEELKEGLPLFFKPYLEGYRERVNALYSDEHANSGIFFYMKPVHLHVLLRNSNTHLLFAESSEDELSFVDCTKIDKLEFDNLSSKSNKLKNNFIESLLSINDYVELFHYPRLGEHAGVSFSEGNRGILVDFARECGADKADDDYNTYNLGKALEKAISPSIELTTVNTDEILERVKDPAFRYEFGESAKAYNAGLYLAAASTAGIALENILRIIISKKLKGHELDERTYIWISVKALRGKNIVPGRLLGEVSSFESVRNSNSHTNEDPVRRETVDTLYRIINELTFCTI